MKKTCVVCKGTGIEHGFNPRDGYWRERCWTCNGTGSIEVPDEDVKKVETGEVHPLFNEILKMHNMIIETAAEITAVNSKKPVVAGELPHYTN
ncbi:MAG: hypothetical protein LBJ63_07765 [Prevotellaceae bacterium]|jgi:hypothetical protein|nr:hypothetical protein [Prevotellaceae bacterium]